MKPKKIWSNLSVNDLTVTTRFYTHLGFKSNGSNEELTSFCFGKDDFVIHFFIKEKFKTAIKNEAAGLEYGNEILFTLSASSTTEVDNWEKEVKAAGGKIISKPEEFGEGYYGFVFADPDNHRFNVFYMKGL